MEQSALQSDQSVEQVVLLDESGHATGVMDKAAVHHRDTPLHLAFSCYVFNARGELLISQRAHHKRTWPGVWTNTCCGHPGPGEPLTASVLRRLQQELGLAAHHVELMLPGFRYRAVMSNGVVENEMCPVFRAFSSDEHRPDPDEVADTRWVAWSEFSSDVVSGREKVSPWCEEQVRELVRLGPEPPQWPVGSVEGLPPAARAV